MTSNHSNGNNSLSVDEKIALITKNLEEVIGYERIRPILAERDLRIYWGTATTGKPHIAYFVPLLKIADFLSAGCQVTILFADLHAYLDNMKAPWKLLDYRTKYYQELIMSMLKSINVPLGQLKFVRGTDFQLTKEYMLDVYKVATLASVHDCRKAGSDVVKQVEHPLLSAYLYPGLQAIDEEYLQVDAQFGGLDQRKIFTFAEKLLPQLGYKKRIHLMNPMIGGLSGGKMSSSEADSKIDLLEPSSELKRKINKSFCEEGNIERNGCLSFCKHIIFPVLKRIHQKTEFLVERKEEHGGNITITSYEQLESLFQEKKLHPSDFKATTFKYFNDILAPIRDHFATPTLKQLVADAYPSTTAQVDPNSTQDLVMLVGEVLSVIQHPEVPKFRVFEIKLSPTENVVVCDSVDSAVSTHMVGRKVVVVTNVQSTKIKSFTSNALLLFVKFFQKTEVAHYDFVQPPASCELNDRVFFSNFQAITNPDKTTKFKLNDPLFSTLMNHVCLSDEGVFEYLNGHLASTHGPIKHNSENGSLVFSSPN